jgi:hypothetical protein
LFDFNKKLKQIFKYPKEIAESFDYLKNFNKLLVKLPSQKLVALSGHRLRDNFFEYLVAVAVNLF